MLRSTNNRRKRTISEANDSPLMGDDDRRLPHQVSSIDGGRRERSEETSLRTSKRRIEDGSEKANVTVVGQQSSSVVNNNTTMTAAENVTTIDAQLQQRHHRQQQKSVVPLSMQLMRPFWAISYCGPDCPINNNNNYTTHTHHNNNNNGNYNFNEDFFMGNSNNTANTGHPPTRNISMASNMNVAAENNSGTTPTSFQHATNNKVVATTTNNYNNSSRRRNSSSSSYVNNSPTSSFSDESSPSSSKQQIKQQQIASTSTNNTTMATLATNTHLNNDNNSTAEVSIEQILNEYTTACSIYGISTRINPGVLTTIRFQLPTLRVSGTFFDADMLALAEILLKHCNGALKYISRLDFTIAGKEGKDRGYGLGSGLGGSGSGKKGIRSHGAYALSKVLLISKYIKEVYLSGNRIGPYGASAIFIATSQNETIQTLLMRGCRILERGALVFANEICDTNSKCGLIEVDLSACRIGFRGCYAIEEALKGRMESKDKSPYQWDKKKTKQQEQQQQQQLEVLGKENENSAPMMMLDLEGNMIFQEVMNCVTHGLGILLGTLGTYLLTRQVQHLPPHYNISCAIYSASIIVLYTSSTLYHSFFALKKTKFIFKVFDRCAIYLLIAGSYTPFLMIALHHEPKWSMYLLLFIWACAISGILVEAFFQTWKHKSKFSLSMYLGMGWSCLACMNDMIEVLSNKALLLIVAGGVAYTGGVPFFVRNNNLDHSLWHLFVLAGSIFHWLSVYWYVAIPSS